MQRKRTDKNRSVSVKRRPVKKDEPKKKLTAVDPVTKEAYIKELVEENMLVATWIDDMNIPQRELESRRLFYLNETLLVKQDVRQHFISKNARKFYA